MIEATAAALPLVEGQRLDPVLVDGVAPARLTLGAARDAAIRFVDEVAAFQNALGVYLIAPDGTIHDPKIVFARLEAAAADPRFPFARPGGGPLAAGDTVALSTLYDAAQLAPGTRFGLFVIADGAAPGRGQAQLLDGAGELALVERASGAPATIFDPADALALRHAAADGTVSTIHGALIHSADPTPDDPARNPLNPDGLGHAVALDDPATGALLIGFEDGTDFDYNDVVVAVELAAPSLNRITGSAGDDRLTGTAAADLIEGLRGADQLIGGDGDDTLEGNRGADLIYGDAPVMPGLRTVTAQDGAQELALSVSAPASVGDGLVDLSGLITPAAWSGETFNLALVVDVSGSMAADFIGARAVGDLNGDGLANTRLDAMIAGLEGLVEGLVESGHGQAVEVGLIPFATGAALAATLAAGSDADGDGRLDLVEQLRTLEFGGGTDYGAAFAAAVGFFAGQPAATNLVYFVSDGQGFGDFAGDLARLADPDGIAATVNAFGIGANLSLAQLTQIDSGGAPVVVTTPEGLTSALTASPLLPAAIAQVDILLDGVPVQSLGPDDLQPTPLGLTFATTVVGLSSAAAASNAIEVVVTPVAGAGGGFSVRHEIVGAGHGADRLIGGLGADELIGGGGPDTFVYRTLDDGVDRILDFDARAGDVIDLGEVLDAAAPAALDELIALTACDADRDGRADDVVLAIDPDAAGPEAASALALLIDPVGLTAGTSAQALADAGVLVI